MAGNDAAGDISEITPSTSISITTDDVDAATSRQQSMFALFRMQPTKRSVILEYSVWLCGIVFALIHFFLATGDHLPISAYIAGCALIILNSVWFYYEVDKRAFLLLLLSFRGFVIWLSLLTVTVADIVEHGDTPLHRVLMDDAVWCVAVFVLVSSDFVPRITTCFRIGAPVSVILNAVNNIFIYHYQNPTFVIWQNEYGAFTVNQIEIIATMQIILCGGAFILGFPRDRKHEFFVILNNRVAIKSVLPLRDQDREKTWFTRKFFIHTRWIFVISTGVFVVTLIFYSLHWGLVSMSAQFEIVSVTWNLLAAFIVSLNVAVLVCNHFDKSILRYCFPQFRLNILMVAVLIEVYLGFQRLWWDRANLPSVNALANRIVYVAGILLLITKDLMLVSYPKWFNAFLSVQIISFSLYNVYLVSFDQWMLRFPAWFLYLEREVLTQVATLCMLNFYNMIRGRDGKYFVLITARKKCKELFWDELQIDTLREPLL